MLCLFHFLCVWSDICIGENHENLEVTKINDFCTFDDCRQLNPYTHHIICQKNEKFSKSDKFLPYCDFFKTANFSPCELDNFVTISESKISMIALMQDIRFRQLKPLKCVTQRKSRGFWIYTILYATYVTTYEQKAK